MRRFLTLGLAILALLGIAPRRSNAYFEEVTVGSRGASLGPAAMGMINDVSAFYWNPAGLSQLGGLEVLADYAKPYALDDVSAGTFAVGARRFGTGWSLGWHRLSLSEVYSEDLVSIAGGREVLRFGNGHAVDAGLTFKLGRIAFQSMTDASSGATIDIGSQSKGSLDAGARWRTPWRVDVAWIARDLLEPRYELVLGSGGDRQVSRQEVAADIRWNQESTIAVGWSSLGDGVSSISAGVEIQFFDVFAVRSGLSNLSRVYQSYGSPTEMQYNGGIGVYQNGYYIDVAATTNRDLGASYRATLRVPIGRGKRP